MPSTISFVHFLTLIFLLVASPTFQGILPSSDHSNSSSSAEEEVVSLNGSNHSHSEHHSHGGVHVATWQWEYVKTPFIYTAFIIVGGLLKLAYHHADLLSSIIPESCLLIILGTVVGVITYLTGSETLLPQFSSRTFFLFLLPPIVLESAYSLHDRLFFSHLGTILLYAVVGTLFNCFTIGPTLYGLSEAGALGTVSLGVIECLAFSALISAVDPVAVLAIFQEVGVHKALYFLVFGESLLNDAVTVVLYTMMVGFAGNPRVTASDIGVSVAAFLCVSLGGLAIGMILGALTALITKHTHEVRVVEPLAMLGIAYLSYLMAEMVHFSGIISIIGCGLVQAQYAWSNISQKSYTTVKYFSKMLSAVCDSIIFLFLGMVLVNDSHVWHTGFVLWSTLLCLVYRFTGVLALTYITNSVQHCRRINLEEQFIMAYGGLRGAVAFSLVIMLEKDDIPHKEIFVTTTLFIILFTVFIQGGTIKPMVNFLKIRTQGDKKCSLFVEINYKVVDSVMTGIEEVTGSHGDHYWKNVLFYYDEKYLKRWLQRECNENVLTRVYTKLVLADHFAHLYGPATAIEGKTSLEILREAQLKTDDDEENLESETADTKRIRFNNNQELVSQLQKGSPTPPSAPRRRHTLVSPVASVKKRSTGSHPEDDTQLLKRAFQENPYFKLHQKYNPNLVGDEQQELVAHLKARRQRARRLTMAAIHGSLDAESSSPVIGGRRPTTATSGGQSDDDAINFLIQRANRRRSIMSGAIKPEGGKDSITSASIDSIMNDRPGSGRKLRKSVTYDEAFDEDTPM